MIAIKIQKSVEKSNDMTSACVLSEGIFQMTAGLLSRHSSRHARLPRL